MTLEGVTVGELGLSGATAHRVTLVDSRVGRLDVTDARLREVDLRGAEIRQVHGVAGLAGATISDDQAAALAPALAAALRIRVEQATAYQPAAATTSPATS
ncbi:MAG TPA: hypothetical protein PKB06_09800, partial [Actinotalea sp.]|nr:hypothetical protein [Actinotalea sp.]